MIRVRACMFSLVALAAASSAAGVAFAATDADTTASFSLAATTEVPGAILKPGQYTIQVVDHLSDRAIVRLDSISGSTHVTFLGVNATGAGNDQSHPVEWPEKTQGKHALRGFIFTGGRTVEFVYPKADAVALANANNSAVVAIDPASEGRPELSKLTTNDMQMVNLWMLTPVRVGPGKGAKGIDAKRYQPTTVVAGAAPHPVDTASPTNMVAKVSAPAGPAPVVARVEPSSRPVIHRARPVVTQLPKTASDLPLVWMGGLVSCTAALLLRRRRVSQA